MKILPILAVFGVIFLIGCTTEDLTNGISSVTTNQPAEIKIDSIEQVNCGIADYLTGTYNQCFRFGITLTNLKDTTLNGYYDAHVVDVDNSDYKAKSYSGDCSYSSLNDVSISISPKASQKIVACFPYNVNQGKLYINIYEGTPTQISNGEVSAQTISSNFNASDFASYLCKDSRKVHNPTDCYRQFDIYVTGASYMYTFGTHCNAVNQFKFSIPEKYGVKADGSQEALYNRLEDGGASAIYIGTNYSEEQVNCNITELYGQVFNAEWEKDLTYEGHGTPQLRDEWRGCEYLNENMTKWGMSELFFEQSIKPTIVNYVVNCKGVNSGYSESKTLEISLVYPDGNYYQY